MTKKKLNLEKAYNYLEKIHAFWDRNSNHIWIRTGGFCTAECQNIEKKLISCGLHCVDQVFDKMVGQTVSTFKHR